MKKITSIVLIVALVFSIVLMTSCGNASPAPAAGSSEGSTVQKEYRFVMIPILAQAWFDIVYNASVEMADQLGQMTGTKITIDYQAPATADLVQQSELLERAIATQPDGIAIDSIDVEAQMPIFQEAKRQGIPIILYVNVAPAGSGIPYCGNDFYEQGKYEAEQLVQRLNGQGKVAIIHGVPTNQPHAERFRAIKDVFAAVPGIQVVAEAFDYDDIENAQREAAQILAAHPDLSGFAVCDAAGPVGVGVALKEAGKQPGQVKYVGIDDLPQLQELMRDGWLDLSVATQPNSLGRWCTLSLFMEKNGVPPVTYFDTKFALLTPDMVKGGNIKGF
jgi:ribose transport system substrate-binding protein